LVIATADDPELTKGMETWVEAANAVPAHINIPSKTRKRIYGVAVTVRVIVLTVVIELVPTTMLVPLIAKFTACEPLSVSAPDQFEGLTA
jgi:hypothetical protein